MVSESLKECEFFYYLSEWEIVKYIFQILFELLASCSLAIFIATYVAEKEAKLCKLATVTELIAAFRELSLKFICIVWSFFPSDSSKVCAARNVAFFKLLWSSKEEVLVNRIISDRLRKTNNFIENSNVYSQKQRIDEKRFWLVATIITLLQERILWDHMLFSTLFFCPSMEARSTGTWTVSISFTWGSLLVRFSTVTFQWRCCLWTIRTGESKFWTRSSNDSVKLPKILISIPSYVISPFKSR